ncbi:MAG: glycine cleavage system protein GcvH [Candidatus Acidulodesulfobacterium ferriphilum]|uniref:Glycine cleavage system H protein n=1 Tax=Candidatus Acidulodesulfobacterium ferriphilum TaxID=2597223 RepID=A0A519BBH2_9DELT|nr:MAG: glycine cleavage system protein GcvH [Candidatus Acidulodesulfobacterium ferriphilum]
MSKLNGCDIPEHLYYSVEKHVWGKIESDGTVTIGMTSVAQSLAGKLLYITPKKVGQKIAQLKSVATVESGKYVGPVPAPFSGEIVAINEDLVKDVSAINTDPYGKGWVCKIKPADAEADKKNLLTGKEAVDAYKKKIEADGIKCE